MPPHKTKRALGTPEKQVKNNKRQVAQPPNLKAQSRASRDPEHILVGFAQDDRFWCGWKIVSWLIELNA
jgi:hypothetical protein